jgi:hypothetical protein
LVSRGDDFVQTDVDSAVPAITVIQSIEAKEPMATQAVSASAPAALSAAEVERFRRDGYLGPYSLCSPDEMAALRPAIERVLDTDPPASHNRVHNRHLDSRAVYDLATDPAIVARMVALYGPDLLLWRTNFFVKNRGSKAIPWHQDFHYWPLEPPVIISAWIAVDPSTRQNGNLQVIPGSHRTIVPHVEATPDMQFKVMADAGYYDPGDLTDLEMQPGEFILFNERTLHHSEPNLSDLRRIGLAVRAIIPIVKVLEYDSPDHALQVIHGTDTMGLNHLAPTTP